MPCSRTCRSRRRSTTASEPACAGRSGSASDNLSITPRLVYQRVETDGWNRDDIFNILANPYTTSRPAVTLGEREQFTQLEEKYTDDFVLGDLNIDYKLDHGLITSITSYTYRDIW